MMDYIPVPGGRMEWYRHPLVRPFYPTDIGWFPNALHHYRDRPADRQRLTIRVLLEVIEKRGVGLQGASARRSTRMRICTAASPTACSVSTRTARCASTPPGCEVRVLAGTPGCTFDQTLA